MTQSLNWTRDGDRLALVGELDQDVLNPLWDARVEAMTGVTCIDLSQVSRVDTGDWRCWSISLVWRKTGQQRVSEGSG